MPLINATQAAELVGLDRQTLINWGNDGTIPHKVIKRTHYFDLDTIKAVVDELRDVEDAKKRLRQLKATVVEETDRERNERHARNIERLVRDKWLNGLTNGFAMLVIRILHTTKDISKRDFDIVSMLINGKQPDEISREYNMTIPNIYSIVFSTIRKTKSISHFETIVHEYFSMGNAMKEKDVQISLLNAKIESLMNLINGNGIHISTDGENASEDPLSTFMALNEKMTNFDLSVRTLNGLRAARIETLMDLCQCDSMDILKIRGCGRKTYTELCNLLESMGLRFGMTTSELYGYARSKQNN